MNRPTYTTVQIRAKDLQEGDVVLLQPQDRQAFWYEVAGVKTKDGRTTLRDADGYAIAGPAFRAIDLVTIQQEVK